MARLRVKFRFNPGRHGAPMDRLGEFTSQAEKFLRSLASDLGLEAKKGEWLASNFRNESFGCDGEYGGALTDAARERGIAALNGVFGTDPMSICNSGLISHVTLAEFAKIGEVLSPDEYFLAGVFETDEADEPSRITEITYKKTAEIRQLLAAPYVTTAPFKASFTLGILALTRRSLVCVPCSFAN